jgi:hypothetical protein
MLRKKNMKKNSLNFALIAKVEESSSAMDVDEIVERNNIIDLCTLKILHDIT